MAEHHHKPCCAPEDVSYDIGSQRQHYFEGKYMTARDFRDEQRYFLNHRHAHNRLLHGWGVVCGLRVDGLERVGCQDRWIKVNSGYALDCYGRELVVEEEFCIELPDQETIEQWEECGYEQQLGVPLTAFPVRRSQDDKNAPGATSTVVEVEYLICLAYYTQPIEQVPALVDGTCGPVEMEYNRVRETVRVIVVRYDQLKDCWLKKRKLPMSPRMDCDEDPPSVAGTCIEPDCACGRVVPLALVRVAVTADGYLGDDFRLVNERQANKEEAHTGKRPTVTLELDGRRRLPTPPSFLTHIVGINWPHGGTLDITDLQQGGKLDGRFEITFDRDIQAAATYERTDTDHYEPEAGEANGINRFTFRVTYTTPKEPGEKEVSFERRAQLDPNNKRKAVFYIDPENWSGDEDREQLPEGNVFIRLLGDFVLDCHDNPIDANHVAGMLPSGNGTPGGTFESWFRLKREYYQRPVEQQKAVPAKRRAN